MYVAGSVNMRLTCASTTESSMAGIYSIIINICYKHFSVYFTRVINFCFCSAIICFKENITRSSSIKTNISNKSSTALSDFYVLSGSQAYYSSSITIIVCINPVALIYNKCSSCRIWVFIRKVVCSATSV